MVLLWTMGTTPRAAATPLVLYPHGMAEEIRGVTSIANRSTPLETTVHRYLPVRIERLSPKLIRLSVEPDGLVKFDAVGGALRRRFYTLCLGSSLHDPANVLVGWSGFLDSTRMMGSQSWEWSMGASVWGRY